MLRRNTKSIGNKNPNRIKTKDGNIPIYRSVVESFFREMYSRANERQKQPRPKITNQVPEEMPQITPYEIKIEPSEMKNDKSRGDDRVVTEAISLV